MIEKEIDAPSIQWESLAVAPKVTCFHKNCLATAFCDSFNIVLSNIPLRTALCHLTLLREQRETTGNSEFLSKIAIFRLFTLWKDVTVCHTLILDVDLNFTVKQLRRNRHRPLHGRCHIQNNLAWSKVYTDMECLAKTPKFLSVRELFPRARVRV